MPFTSLELDFEQHLANIELSDGRRETFPVPKALLAGGVPFLRSRFDFTSDTLSFTVASGDVLIVEVGAVGCPPTGRPVVWISSIGSVWPSSATHRRS